MTDPRADIQAWFYLVEMDTPDETARFLVGSEGVFTDTNGNEWAGSELITTSQIESMIGDSAPSGTITLTYFQDPDQEDLQSQVAALGAGYLDGREIRFYYQEFNSLAEMHAPTIPPELEYTRIMRGVSFNDTGVSGRSVTVNFETWAEGRNYTRKIPFSVEGHEQLLGASNPSLTYRPTDSQEDVKLF